MSGRMFGKHINDAHHWTYDLQQELYKQQDEQSVSDSELHDRKNTQLKVKDDTKQYLHQQEVITSLQRHEISYT